MCVCVCVCAHAHAYVYAHVHTHVSIHLCVCMSPCVCAVENMLTPIPESAGLSLSAAPSAAAASDPPMESGDSAPEHNTTHG